MCNFQACETQDTVNGVSIDNGLYECLTSLGLAQVLRVELSGY